MGKRDNDGGYCFDILKEGLTNKHMSGGERAWSIGAGLIGTIVIDPVLLLSEKLGLKSEHQDYDSTDPTHPFNQNY